MLIKPETKLGNIFEEHPEVKETLKEMSPKFSKLDNKMVFNTVGKFARIKDIAKMGGFSTCEVLHTLNKVIGKEDELAASFPECLDAEILIEVEKDDKPEWFSDRETFTVMNVIGSEEDPLAEIMKKAQSIKAGDGFKLIQIFEPIPLINMLNSLGFEHYTEQINDFKYEVFFYKKESKSSKIEDHAVGDKVPVVIQSATPVVYPIIMKLLKSTELMDKIEIKELKMWDKAEKHMSWLMNGKADITFSAVVAAAKLYLNGIDLRMKSINVWDNFYLLTRGYQADSFADLKEHTIHVPLAKGTPPFGVTKYLMKKQGYNPEEFDFAFGQPFGRPEDLKAKFVRGEIDTVLLREPEASFALKEAADAVESIAYKDLWQEIHPEAGKLPNAGLVFNGDFADKHPEIVELFMNEIEKAIKEINEDPKKSAEESFDIMGQTPEAVEKFLDRVTFEFKSGLEYSDKIIHYLKVLAEENSFKSKGELSELENMFK
jgi:NitT/TauT family transport system substrate-binding protein